MIVRRSLSTPYGVEVGEVIALTIHPDDGREAAVLAGLRHASDRPVAVAFGLQAHSGRVVKAQQTVEGGRETWHVELQEEERFYGDSFMQDMSFNEISADDLALL